MDKEEQYYKSVANKIEELWRDPRWNTVHRPYSAEQVAAILPTLKMQYPSSLLARKLFDLLHRCREKKSYT